MSLRGRQSIALMWSVGRRMYRPQRAPERERGWEGQISLVWDEESLPEAGEQEGGWLAFLSKTSSLACQAWEQHGSSFHELF